MVIKPNFMLLIVLIKKCLLAYIPISIYVQKFEVNKICFIFTLIMLPKKSNFKS